MAGFVRENEILLNDLFDKKNEVPSNLTAGSAAVEQQ
ncbi:hypothetical protein MNBD_GAMMA07-2422 [hydrothermal vent metagenome]|uniref:Uncharacterized protein n=1 Tax=hydrothermal vent metagenome TaxID=652676 RepID=A0A3B0X676_9ZZZZ